MPLELSSMDTIEHDSVVREGELVHLDGTTELVDVVTNIDWVNERVWYTFK